MFWLLCVVQAASLQKPLQLTSSLNQANQLTLNDRLPHIQDWSNVPVSQLRLAFNGPGMTVSWNSATQLETPTVYFSRSCDSVLSDSSALGNASTIFATANTWDNHVSVDGLEPNTKYFYRVSGQEDSQSLCDQFFVTARAPGDKAPFSVAIWGDLGILAGSTPDSAYIPHTFDSLERNRQNLDFLVHAGDLGYADNWLYEMRDGLYPHKSGIEAYTDIMASYYHELSAVTKNTAYMVGPGNHEAQCNEADLSLCPEGQRNFTGLRNHFAMPRAGQVEGYVQNMWYSFDYGMAHFIMLNTETDFADSPDEGRYNDVHAGPFGVPGQQVEWLERDLQAVDRTKTPWIIMSGHRPWYSAEGVGCTACREAFDDLAVQYGVDLVWWGHVHYYERDLPLVHGVPDPAGYNNPKGPVYITVGGAGNVEGHSQPNPDRLKLDWVQVVNNKDFGWGKLDFVSESELVFQYIGSKTGHVLDKVVLTKKR